MYCMSLGCALNHMRGCFVGPHLTVAAIWLPFALLSLLSHPISPRVCLSPRSVGCPIMRSIGVCAGTYRCTLHVCCRSRPCHMGSMHVGHVRSPWPPFMRARAVAHNRRGSARVTWAGCMRVGWMSCLYVMGEGTCGGMPTLSCKALWELWTRPWCRYVCVHVPSHATSLAHECSHFPLHALLTPLNSLSPPLFWLHCLTGLLHGVVCESVLARLCGVWCCVAALRVAAPASVSIVDSCMLSLE